MSADPPVYVSELIDAATKAWDHQKVHEHLQPPDAELILKIPLSTRNIADSWAWHYERSGLFTVRSAYRLLVDTKRRREDWLEGRPNTSDVSATQGQWKKLWRVKVPSVVRHFAWRLAKNSVPTESVRHHRKMTDEALCPICNGAEDSWRQALVDCNMPKCVWALMDDQLVEHMVACKNDDARLWLMELMETTREEEFVRILVTLWSIWWAHRKAIHEQEFQSPLSTFCFVEKYLGDLLLLSGRAAPNNTVCTATEANVGRRKRTWKQPRQGHMKVMVDAAVARSGHKGSCAAICRDEDGHFLGASSVVVLGQVDPEILEAMAFSEGLDLSSDLYLQRVHVSTDCAATISHMKGTYKGPSTTVIQDIGKKMESFESVCFEHEKRDMNWEAHDLARASTSLECDRQIGRASCRERVSTVV